MAKKRKSTLWRFFVGVGKAAVFTVKGIGKAGIFMVRGLGKGFKHGIKAQQTRTNPTYRKEALSEKFKVIKTVKGRHEPFERRLMKDSAIALVFGKRGSGKSALGFKILENIHAETERQCYVLGMEKIVLPKWIKSVRDIEEVGNDSVLLVDEGAVSFSSRESLSDENKDLGKLLPIARHKNLTIIFITQNTGLIDKNILKLSDILFVKEGSLLQLEMERPEIQKFYKNADMHLDKIKDDKRKYAYVIESDFEGVVSHSLPSFWGENISKNRE
jgi:hypothetical protein